MYARIKQVIETSTGGKVAEFARMMGWSPQYVTNLTSGRGSVGIQPVVALLEKFPNLDARWLLLGEGVMFKPDIVERTKGKLQRLMELEQYVPYMTASELQKYNRGEVDFPPKRIASWAQILQENCNTK